MPFLKAVYSERTLLVKAKKASKIYPNYRTPITQQCVETKAKLSPFFMFFFEGNFLQKELDRETALSQSSSILLAHLHPTQHSCSHQQFFKKKVLIKFKPKEQLVASKFQRQSEHELALALEMQICTCQSQPEMAPSNLFFLQGKKTFRDCFKGFFNAS